MKKYLFTSLEKQSCKDFTFVLIIGNEANITHIKSFFNFNNSFKKIIIPQKKFKNYVRKIAKGFDVLISSRYDYDDRIYYDAVNDIRKEVNYNKPMFLYGYNRGFIYFESNDTYYEFERNFNLGVMSIFFSLITIIDKVNDTYTILDLGNHACIKKNLLDNYKLYGIPELKYDPALFEAGSPKFVYVRQNYSSYYNKNKQIYIGTRINNFNLSKFYGE